MLCLKVVTLDSACCVEFREGRFIVGQTSCLLFLQSAPPLDGDVAPYYTSLLAKWVARLRGTAENQIAPRHAPTDLYSNLNKLVLIPAPIFWFCCRKLPERGAHQTDQEHTSKIKK